jgi:hypothetical protein
MSPLRLLWLSGFCFTTYGCAPQAQFYSALQTNPEGTVKILNATESRDLRDLAAAHEAAQAWLEYLARDRTEEAWEASSDFMKGSQARGKAISRLRQNRRRLGRLVERQALAQARVEQLPGAPPGVYVVLQYRAKYEGREAFYETVTLVLEEGGWRVAGYFMK